MKWWRGALALAILATVVSAHAQSGPAYFVRNLDHPRERREARADILDTPVLPGSVVKAVALVAALDSGVVRADTNHMCRRTVTVDGQKFVCAHPDLKRALSPAEALAYSCNDFFVSLASRLSRDTLNKTRLAAGLAPIATGTPMSAALVGLAGPRTSPRALVDVMARLVGAGKDKPVPMSAATRSVLLDGLRGAAEYGTASAFKTGGVSALAKTGSILMPSGASLGLVVALTPAVNPTHGLVVAAPGGAGVDAAAIAADVWSQRTSAPQHPGTPAPAPAQTRAPQAPYAPLAPIRLGRTLASGSTRVETIAVDDYIAQVLAGEGQPRAGDAAQQALAITARTFAIANRNRHRREGFDLCDTTHCQVVRAATATTRRAVQATSGRLLLHQGQPAFVFYSASCGGRTERASDVWPGAIDYASQPSVHDDADESEPGWESNVRVQDVERALRAAGLRGDRVRDIKVTARNGSNRVSRVRIEGFAPPEMSGPEFRMAVGRVAGFAAIKSTAFEINRTSSGYHFRGRGFGHGVGLCVIGAGTRASRGDTADEILRFYYPGLTVGVGEPGALTSAAPGAPAAPSAPAAPVAAASTDIALVLPGNEERERGTLLTLVRRTRDDIAKATGAIPPARLRITVHPSVDSFGRATGQPWWVSGATEGAAIDLLPLTTLKQQGQLERTVRHEVVHALLDGALSKRPMWVREGAAGYFASPPSSRPASGRVTCPKDAELLRPISAGAQREAYARAEACFAREIAAGKRWDRVR